jgi:vacuolar iron transporter family protein
MVKNPKLYLKFWHDEKNSAVLYGVLAEVEKDTRIQEIYRRMEKVELKHAQTWVEKIKESGEEVPVFTPTWRTNILTWIARRFGPDFVLQSLQSIEQSGTSAYSQQIDSKKMAADERSHAMLLNQLVRTVRGGMEGGTLAQFEGRHRSTGGNALRAAVLGANDGLVSNLSLVMGVAGATFENRAVLIAGLAGLLAGAFSMALGEWLSVQSSRELYANQIKIETEEIESAPQEEAEELALIYQARGLNQDQSRMLATQILSNKTNAVETLAREELGLDPKELGGSAWEAAITSFILFTIGAVIPVIPFMFWGGITAVIGSIVISTLGLFLLGSIITLFTGRTILYSGLRMVIFGLIAAAITFGIGRLIGVSIG